MDRATVNVQTAPQVVSIGLDPVVAGLLADLGNTLGNVYGELAAIRALLEAQAAPAPPIAVTPTMEMGEPTMVATPEGMVPVDIAGLIDEGARAVLASNPATLSAMGAGLTVDACREDAGRYDALNAALGASPGVPDNQAMAATAQELQAAGVEMQSATPVALPKIATTKELAEIYKGIADKWVFNPERDGYLIREDTPNGFTTRPATATEARAIDADIAKGRKGKRR